MIDTLIEKINITGAPVCVGLDPRLSFIPDSLKNKVFDEMGLSLESGAQVLWEFNKHIIDAVLDIVPAVKPQIAMYEQFGVPGIKAYVKTVNYAKKAGLVVIGDVKRGDIGTTSEAYSNAHIGVTYLRNKDEKAAFSAFDSDFATVNPYMGSDGIVEFFKDCREFNKGIFVLLKTSNPSSSEFQDLDTGGMKLYERVALKIDEWGEDLVGKSGYSDVGAVVGATFPEEGKKLRDMLPHTFFLVPGYGAQGAGASDIAPFFDNNGIGAIVNSSRGIMAAYQLDKYHEYGEEGYADAARRAALDMIQDIRKNCLGMGG